MANAGHFWSPWSSGWERKKGRTPLTFSNVALFVFFQDPDDGDVKLRERNLVQDKAQKGQVPKRKVNAGEVPG